MVGESPFSFALSPESHEHQVAGRSSGLSPPLPPSRQDSVSDIMEEAQIRTHSYGYSR